MTHPLLAPYQPLRSIYQTLHGWQKEHPDLVRVQEIGKSSGGRSILAAAIGRNPKAPVLSLTALFHSMEFPGPATVMRFAQEVLAKPKDKLLDQATLCLVPVVHPDGYEQVWQDLENGKRWFFHRYTQNRVNLNRNFGPGFHHAPKRSPGSGERPFSEPESRALKNWHDQHPPRVSMCFHTCAHYLVYPWAYHHGPPPPQDMAVYDRLYQAFSKPMARPFRWLQSSHFNGHTGDYQDWVYGHYRAASLLIEMGRPALSVNAPNMLLNPFLFFNFPSARGLEKDVSTVTAGLWELWRETPGVAPMVIGGFPKEVDYRTTLLI